MAEKSTKSDKPSSERKAVPDADLQRVSAPGERAKPKQPGTRVAASTRRLK